MPERWPPMVGVVGFDGGSRPAVALAIPPGELTSDEGGEEGPGPGPGPGACCYTDGTCDTILEVDCIAAGNGEFQGEGTTCDDVTCTGACCEPGCVEDTTPDGCSDDGGTFQGFGTTCDPNPCPLPPCNGCGFAAFDGSGRMFLHRESTCGYDKTDDYSVVCPLPTGRIEYRTYTSDSPYIEDYDEDCNLTTTLGHWTLVARNDNCGTILGPFTTHGTFNSAFCIGCGTTPHCTEPTVNTADTSTTTITFSGVSPDFPIVTGSGLSITTLSNECDPGGASPFADQFFQNN